MINTIYTIGYSGFSMNDFLNTISSHKISLIVDVRSQPYSRFFPDYNIESLKIFLAQKGIFYRNYDKAFGARQENHSFYSKDGYLDFEQFTKSEQYIYGFEKLVKSMKQDYMFALMCAEKDPINCHRSIMIARTFSNVGYNVIHLMPDDIVMTQQDIEERLLDRYFTNREQATIFDKNISKNEYIQAAYKKRNAEIGYTIEEETE